VQVLRAHGRLFGSSRAAAFHGVDNQAAGSASELAQQLIGADHSLGPARMCSYNSGFQRHALFKCDVDDPLRCIGSRARNIGLPSQANSPGISQDLDAGRSRNQFGDRARQQQAGYKRD